MRFGSCDSVLRRSRWEPRADDPRPLQIAKSRDYPGICLRSLSRLAFFSSVSGLSAAPAGRATLVCRYYGRFPGPASARWAERIPNCVPGYIKRHRCRFQTSALQGRSGLASSRAGTATAPEADLRTAAASPGPASPLRGRSDHKRQGALGYRLVREGAAPNP